MGRGIFYLQLSNAIWILSAFAIHVGMGRLLGPSSYGIFGVVVAILSIFHLILSNGINHAVTKFISEKPKLRWRIWREGVKIQVAISLAMSGGLVLFSGLLSNIFGEDSLKNLIRLSALIIPFAGIYYTYTGYLLGLRKYGYAALLNALYALFKAGLVILFVLLGMNLYGAILGLILSVFLTCLASVLLCGFENYIGSNDSLRLIRFAFPVMLFHVSAAILINGDIFFVKSILTDDLETGFYAAAQSISRIIYFVSALFLNLCLKSWIELHYMVW